MPTISKTNIGRTKPWPGYFVVRPTGEVVPLIAIDELPPGTDLLGVPRSLDLETTIGMLNLGLQQSSRAFYQIRRSKEENCSTADLTSDSKFQLASPSIPPKASETHQPSTKGLTTNTTTIISPSPSPRTTAQRHNPPAAEQQICRYWCTHGTCKWGQNCHHRHMMPMTVPDLQAIGLQDWPSWYRALNPAYFTSSGETSRPIARRPRAGACTGGRGCAASVSNAVLVQKGVQRLRRAVQHGGWGAGETEGERVMKDEERGEQIMDRLRSMQGAEVGKVQLRKRDHVSRNVMLERAADKDAKDWEEEGSSDVGIEGVMKRGAVTKEKLVDV